MKNIKITLPEMELKFAEIVWKNAPCEMKKIVEISKIEFSWAVTTTN